VGYGVGHGASRRTRSARIVSRQGARIMAYGLGLVADEIRGGGIPWESSTLHGRIVTYPSTSKDTMRAFTEFHIRTIFYFIGSPFRTTSLHIATHRYISLHIATYR
jgi:hypothetical protein